MARQTKEEFRRKRKPSIFIVCEGRNKTEKTYFNHFNERNASFNLRVFDSESTDITSMAKKATSLFINYQLDLDIGDKVYCLVDLDLEPSKHEKFLKAKETYKKIEIIPSNPCFEIWYLLHSKKVSRRLETDECLKFLKNSSQIWANYDKGKLTDSQNADFSDDHPGISAITTHLS